MRPRRTESGLCDDEEASELLLVSFDAQASRSTSSYTSEHREDRNLLRAARDDRIRARLQGPAFQFLMPGKI